MKTIVGTEDVVHGPCVALTIQEAIRIKSMLIAFSTKDAIETAWRIMIPKDDAWKAIEGANNGK